MIWEGDLGGRFIPVKYTRSVHNLSSFKDTSVYSLRVARGLRFGKDSWLQEDYLQITDFWCPKLYETLEQQEFSILQTPACLGRGAHLILEQESLQFAKF
jgi:hypothetical protein